MRLPLLPLLALLLLRGTLSTLKRKMAELQLLRALRAGCTTSRRVMARLLLAQVTLLVALAVLSH